MEDKKFWIFSKNEKICNLISLPKHRLLNTPLFWNRRSFKALRYSFISKGYMFFDSNLYSFTFQILKVLRLNSQAPDVPGLAIQGIFSSKGSAWTALKHALSKRWKNIPFNLTLRILWKNCQYYRIIVEVIVVLWNFVLKIYTLNGVYIMLNFASVSIDLH